MSYTKGPWQVIEGEYPVGEINTIVRQNTKARTHRCICTIHMPHTDKSIANAHLIAAAPDLLAACKAQHEAIDRLFALLISKDIGFFPSKSGQPWEAIKQGQQAIAKAEQT